MENKVRRIKNAMLILLWVDVVILLPCFIASLRWILLIATKIDVLEINLLSKIFELLEMASVVPLMFFVLGRCFFLPEILFGVSVILQIIYFVLAKNSEQRTSRTAILCVLLDIFCVTALLSAQAVFDTAMSV